MKVTLKHSKLSKALSYASKAVSAKPNIPILSNVLLKAEENSIRVAATNLDMGINMWIPCSIEADGSTTVNAKYISDFVSATSTDENLNLDLDGTTLNVKTSKSKANFTTILPDEFPVLPKLAEKPIFTIAVHDFVESMDKTLFACSTDLSAGRIQQSGVLFELYKEINEIHFIGLDGFRLSRKVAQITNIDTEIEKSEIIVSARYLNELVRILSDYPEVENLDVYLSESGSQIIFKFEDNEFSIRLLEGPYPDYKRIMPDDFLFGYEVDKKELEGAIKIINTFARGNLGNKTLLDFDLENSEIRLKSAVAEVGEGETEVTVTNPTGESDLKTAYTLRYLQDIVSHSTGDKLIIETKGPLAATVFKDNNDPRFIHLIMPMRRDS